MDRRRPTPQGQTAQILVEFLEVAVNCIVFLKGFYPERAFARRRYMNVVVHKALHPQLADYIHSATFGLLPFIQKGLVERVTVIFYDKDKIPVERFVFKLTVSQSYSTAVEEKNLEFALRAFLIKLTVAEPLTKSLPSGTISQKFHHTNIELSFQGSTASKTGSSWEITAYFRTLPEDNKDKEAQMWVPTDTKQWLQPPRITPIKSMSSEPLVVQLYLEHPTSTELADHKR